MSTRVWNTVGALVSVVLFAGAAQGQVRCTTDQQAYLATGVTSASPPGLRGRTVDISGNDTSGWFAVVGLPHETASGFSQAGKVQIYRRDSAACDWEPLGQELESPNARSSGRFGASVAVDAPDAAQSWIVIGAPGENPPPAPGVFGRAYFYQYNDALDTWELKDTELGARNGFGAAVDIDGNTAVVTATGGLSIKDVNFYARGGGVWNKTTTFTEPSSGFGATAALDGDRAVVGAGDSELVFLYKREFALWTEVFFDDVAMTTGFPSPEPEANAEYGYAVSLNGSAVAVGAPGQIQAGSVSAMDDVGAVFVFDFEDPRFEDLSSPPARIDPEGVAGDGFNVIGGSFGEAVALDRNAVLIGQPDIDADAEFSGQPLGFAGTGVVHTFRETGGNWLFEGVARNPGASAPPGTNERFGESIAAAWPLAILHHPRDGASGAVGIYRVGCAPACRGALTQLIGSDEVPNGDSSLVTFGREMAADGDVLAIARQGGTGGLDYAELFEYLPGAGYVFTARLVSQTAPSNFGTAIDTSQDRVVVGHRAGSRGYQVFEKDLGSCLGPGGWCHVQSITVGDGESASIDGDVLVIGDSINGWIRVYRRDGMGVWQFEDELDGSTTPTAITSRLFDVSGDTLAVVQRGSTNAIVVFEYDSVSGSWAEDAQIPFPDGSSDRFGISGGTIGTGENTGIRIDGNTIAVGDDGNDEQGFNSGAVYVFERDGGAGSAWFQTAKIYPDIFQDTLSNPIRFGKSIDLEGDLLAIGSDRPNSLGVGRVYVCNRGPCGWTRQPGLVPISERQAGGDPPVPDFGETVALADGRLSIGSPTTEDLEPFCATFEGINADAQCGGVFVFDMLNPGDTLDRDGNGVPDIWDIDTDPSLDCDSNGLLDSWEIANSAQPLDCNGNGTLDRCEGLFTNIDFDLLCDDAEASTLQNCNLDKVLDAPELGAPIIEIVYIIDNSGSMGSPSNEAILCTNDLAGAVESHITTNSDFAVRSVVLQILGNQAGTFPLSCFDGTVESEVCVDVPGVIQEVDSSEDWANGVAMIAERYSWTDCRNRFIVPIGDEGPENGGRTGAVGDGAEEADDIAARENAEEVAIRNGVRVIPVVAIIGGLLTADPGVEAQMDLLRMNTGGDVTDAPADIGAIPLDASDLVDRLGDSMIRLSDSTLVGDHVGDNPDVISIPCDCCVGDITGPMGYPDGTVDTFDFAQLASNFGRVNPTYLEGDIDLDGDADTFDFAELSGNFGCNAPSANSFPGSTGCP